MGIQTRQQFRLDRVVAPEKRDFPINWDSLSCVTMPLEVHAAVAECITDAALQLLESEGVDAFAMPRSAAIAHEASHCVVGVASGLDIVSTEVFDHSVGQWGGSTDEATGWRIESDTPTAAILARIRFLVAGVVGETLFDAANYRHGSSLNEIVLSQMMADGLWHERGAEFPAAARSHALWSACWQQTGVILMRNAKVVRKLMLKLDRDGEVRGVPLKAVLRRVVPWNSE